MQSFFHIPSAMSMYVVLYKRQRDITVKPVLFAILQFSLQFAISVSRELKISQKKCNIAFIIKFQLYPLMSRNTSESEFRENFMPRLKWLWADECRVTNCFTVLRGTNSTETGFGSFTCYKGKICNIKVKKTICARIEKKMNKHL